MKTFYQQLERDFRRVHMNPNEFGEAHEVNGRNITCVLTDETYDDTRPSKALGVFRMIRTLTVWPTEFGPKPLPGSDLTIDRTKYRVVTIEDEIGGWYIHLERWSQ